MTVAQVPRALAERLGDDGTAGLLTLLASAKVEWTDDVVTSALDRFERRLTIEASSLRADVTRETTAFRQEVTSEMVALRQDMTSEMAALRQDMTSGMAVLRLDMTSGMSALRQEFTKEVASVRVDVLKWSLLFWAGQLTAMAGLLAFMLRS